MISLIGCDDNGLALSCMLRTYLRIISMSGTEISSVKITSVLAGICFIALLYAILPSFPETYFRKRLATALFFEDLFNTYCQVAMLVEAFLNKGSSDICILFLPYAPEL